MPEKKPYESPKVIRVELNQDQAILATCSTTVTTNSTGGTRSCRPATNCKRDAKGGGDSAIPPS